MSITRTSRKPTVVLVHGAFADSSSWDGIVDLLLEDDFPVLAVANPLRGVRADSEYLASVLDGLPGDLVLVGHSYGGMLIANAATGNDRVKALVFVGAFAPEAGESAADLAGRYEGSTLAETLNAVSLPDGGTDLYIAQDRYHAQFAADVSVRVAERMAATQRPIAAAALAEASGTPAWRTIPSWFTFGTGDRNIPVDALRFMAERAGSQRTVELQGASHAVAVTEAAAIAALIGEAAEAAASRSNGRVDVERVEVGS
jgi:pimeloyl-ACP methyl ester carboxylesterase